MSRALHSDYNKTKYFINEAGCDSLVYFDLDVSFNYGDSIEYIESENPIFWRDGNIYDESTNGEVAFEEFTENYCRINYILNYKRLDVNSIQQVDQSIIFYPNPFNNTLNISLPYDSKITVTDSKGIKLSEFNYFKGENIADLEKFESGVYYFLIQNKQMKIFTKKVVKL